MLVIFLSINDINGIINWMVLMATNAILMVIFLLINDINAN